MEVISIERSTYEELHPRLTPAPYQGTSNVSQMKEMAGRGTDKRLGEWLDRSNLFACQSKNQDVCQILNISPRTLQTLRQKRTLAYSQIEHKTYYKLEDVERIIPLVEIRKKDAHSCGHNKWEGGGI